MRIKRLERFGPRRLALGTATAVLAALLATDTGLSAEHDDDAPVPAAKVEKVSKEADQKDGAPKESWTSGLSPKKHVVEPMDAADARESEDPPGSDKNAKADKKATPED